MAIQIRLLQHKRKDLNGKWYGRAVSIGEVGIKEMAKKISESNSVTESDVNAVIVALVEEMKYQLQSGKTVVVDGLGRFHLTVKSDLVEKKEDFNLKKHIKKIMCKFTPAGHKDRLTRKMERDFCTKAELCRWTADGKND